LKPNQQHTPRVPAVQCDVTAQALVCVPLAALADLRRQPGPPSAPELPSTFLKHSDDQSVAGLSAVLHAIANYGLSATDFSRWGIVCAPRFPGRSGMIPAVKHFIAEGAWGVSPHLVPHRSLHSLSGTISQALKIHGPNYGVGGGNSAAREVLFAALALLEPMRLPGVWLVITAQEPEAALDDSGNGPPNKCVRALALALTPVSPAWRGLRLTLEMDALVQPASPDYFMLFTMIQQLAAHREPGSALSQSLSPCARLTLAWATSSVCGTRNAECGTRNGNAEDANASPSSIPHPAFRIPHSRAFLVREHLDVEVPR
jgi:hypothetical protein